MYLPFTSYFVSGVVESVTAPTVSMPWTHAGDVTPSFQP